MYKPGAVPDGAGLTLTDNEFINLQGFHHETVIHVLDWFTVSFVLGLCNGQYNPFGAT